MEELDPVEVHRRETVTSVVRVALCVVELGREFRSKRSGAGREEKVSESRTGDVSDGRLDVSGPGDET